MALVFSERIPFPQLRGLKSLSLPTTALPHANAYSMDLESHRMQFLFHYAHILCRSVWSHLNAFGVETSFSDCGVSTHSMLQLAGWIVKKEKTFGENNMFSHDSVDLRCSEPGWVGLSERTVHGN